MRSEAPCRNILRLAAHLTPCIIMPKAAKKSKSQRTAYERERDRLQGLLRARLKPAALTTVGVKGVRSWSNYDLEQAVKLDNIEQIELYLGTKFKPTKTSRRQSMPASPVAPPNRKRAVSPTFDDDDESGHESGDQTEEESEDTVWAQVAAKKGRPALMPMDVLLPVGTRVAKPTAKWRELMMMGGDWSPAQARSFMQKCRWPEEGGDEKWQKEVWKEILLLSASCGYIEKMHRERPYLRLHPSPQLFARILKTVEWEASEKNGYSEGSRSWAKRVQTLVHARGLYLVYRYTLELPNGSDAREALEEKMWSAKMDPAVVGQADGQSYAGITGVMYDDECKIKDVTYVDPAQRNRETRFTASEQQRLQAFAS
eukprot:COSAG01_NODE_3679_length_5802_cov_347.111520_6_plen_370_part_01